MPLKTGILLGKLSMSIESRSTDTTECQSSVIFSGVGPRSVLDLTDYIYGPTDRQTKKTPALRARGVTRRLYYDAGSEA